MARSRTRLTSKLPRLAAKAPALASAVVAKTAMDIEAQAKANIQANEQIDTGNMLNSTQASEENPLRWVIVVAAFYGIYQELGTVFQGARPFLLPASDQLRPSFRVAMAAAIAKAAK